MGRSLVTISDDIISGSKSTIGTNQVLGSVPAKCPSAPNRTEETKINYTTNNIILYNSAQALDIKN